MRRPGQFQWDIGIVSLSEYDADGFLGVQVTLNGDASSAETQSGCPSAEAFFPLGFYARPRDPTVGPDGEPTYGTSALYAFEGDQLYAWPMTDPTLVQRLPKLAKGSALMFGESDDGQLTYIRASGSDGSIVLYVPGDTLGSYIKLDRANGFEMSNAWGRMRHGPTGFHVEHVNGTAIHMTAASLPAPFDALSSAVTIQGGAVNISGGAVSLGSDGGQASETAVTYLSTLVLQLIAAIGSITSATPGASALTTAGIDPVTLATTLPLALAPIGKVV